MNTAPFNAPLARSSLAVVSDAVHGGIDVRDVSGCGTEGVIAKLLHSAMVTRLRRVEQLGFASQQYIAADHSRYAHAVGTMHMMRLILEHLRDRNASPLNEVEPLKKAFPDAFAASRTREQDVAIAMQHMLIAALLQDVGELPYNMASVHVCTPHDKLRAGAADWLGLENTGGWTHKEVFTVGALRKHWEDTGANAPQGVDHRLLVFLIAGASKDHLATFKAWRHMLDGVVDADRLDYVFRDGHHTVGRLGGPLTVIESMVQYDEGGPVFSSPGPVSQFLAARAHLYSAVYLSPQNRFRMIVLIHLLKGVAEQPALAKHVFEADGDKLQIEDFLRLDDVSLSERLRRLAANPDLRRQLDAKAEVALSVFVSGEPRYAPYWLAAPASPPAGPALALPPELFWDTFTDVGGPIYVRDTIRVQNDQFKYLSRQQPDGADPLIPLEMCGGPFDLIARPKSFMLPTADGKESSTEAEPSDADLRPMPHCVLLFEPEAAAAHKSGFWPIFRSALHDGRLYAHLMANDPLTPHGVPPTTWDKDTFLGPRIFISYAMPDRSVVLKLTGSLHRRQRQYCALTAPYQNLIVPPSQNVEDHLARAEAVVLVVSDAYRQAYADPKRHVRREVDYMIKHRERLILLPVPADPFDTLHDALPWSQLGWTEDPPWLGEKDLRELPTPDVDQAVAAVLDYIDNRRKKA